MILPALFMVLVEVTTCGSQPDRDKRREEHLAGMTIAEVLRQHTPHLMSIPGVVGTAIGQRDGSPCITVLVTKKTSDLMKKIPPTLEGFPVVVEETGAIRPIKTSAFGTPVER